MQNRKKDNKTKTRAHPQLGIVDFQKEMVITDKWAE